MEVLNNGRPPVKLARIGTPITAETTVTASVVSTTETLLATIATLPANFFTVGKSLMLVLHGRVTQSGTGPTVKLRLRYGGLAGVEISQSGAMAAASGAQTGGIMSNALITCVTVGAAGTVWTTGQCQYPTGAAATVADATNPWGTSIGVPAAAAVAIDTTTQNDLVLTAEWSANTAGNSVMFGPGICAFEL